MEDGGREEGSREEEGEGRRVVDRGERWEEREGGGGWKRNEKEEGGGWKVEGGGRRVDFVHEHSSTHYIFTKEEVCNVFRQLSSSRVGSLSALLYASGFCHTLALGCSRVHTPALSSPHTHTLLTKRILLFIVL